MDALLPVSVIQAARIQDCAQLPQYLRSLLRHVLVGHTRVDQQDSFVCTCSVTNQQKTLPSSHHKENMTCVLAAPDIASSYCILFESG